MFATIDLANSIETAEARLIHDVVQSARKNGKAPSAFARKLSSGVAGFIRRGSPMNKVIGVGFEEKTESWKALEQEYHAEHEPVHVELSTLCPTPLGKVLTKRGYRLMGFENVLGITLDETESAESATRVQLVTARELPEWQRLLIDGFSAPDATGIVLDNFTRDVISQAMEDMTFSSGYERYLAKLDGHLVGAAGMRLDGHIALLTGAATLPSFRKRGVQRALLARRLADAAQAGAQLAVITTGGGTQSMANAIKQGFRLLYSRAILELPRRGKVLSEPQPVHGELQNAQ
jgi:GNAT superfamily N-acetyltransferase